MTLTAVAQPSLIGARLWWGAVIPTAGIILGSVVVLVGWYPQLPELFANQWKNGEVSTVRPFWASFAPILVLSPAGLLYLLVLHWSGKLDGWGRRLTVAVLTALPAFLAGTPLLLAGPQRGLSDPHLAPEPGWNLVWLTGASVAWGILASLLAGGRPLPPAGGEASAPPALTLARGERALWIRTETGWVFLVAGIGGGAGLVLCGLVTPLWFLSLLGSVLMLLALPLSRWTITVSTAGLSVRSLGGLARWAVPVHPDAVAGVDRVGGPLEFMGWGLRIGAKGSMGLVLRNGERLTVRRAGGKSFAVTVQDAATGAALFNSQVQRTT